MKISIPFYPIKTLSELNWLDNIRRGESSERENLLLHCCFVTRSFTMLCIQFHAPLLPLQSHLKHKKHSRTPQLLWLSSCEATQFFPHRPNNLSLLAPRTNAIPYSLLLGASSEAEPADIKGQLQIIRLVLFHPPMLSPHEQNILTLNSQ